MQIKIQLVFLLLLINTITFASKSYNLIIKTQISSTFEFKSIALNKIKITPINKNKNITNSFKFEKNKNPNYSEYEIKLKLLKGKYSISYENIYSEIIVDTIEIVNKDFIKIINPIKMIKQEIDYFSNIESDTIFIHCSNWGCFSGKN